MATAQAYKDVATVVSILPYAIEEKKPGLTPGVFAMKAAKPNDFELLVVERCQHPVYLDEARPRLIVPDPADTVATSIVNDHKIAIPGYVAGQSEPGLAWVPGEFQNNDEGKKLFAGMHSAVLRNLNVLQTAWFVTLVRIADDDWARYHSHKMITKVQRIAAMSLGLTQKDWMLEQEISAALTKCKFCFTNVDPQAIICPQCHGVLDKTRYDKEFVAHTPNPPATATK